MCLGCVWSGGSGCEEVGGQGREGRVAKEVCSGEGLAGRGSVRLVRDEVVGDGGWGV